jgi:hypothetical protein
VTLVVEPVETPRDSRGRACRDVDLDKLDHRFCLASCAAHVCADLQSRLFQRLEEFRGLLRIKTEGRPGKAWPRATASLLAGEPLWLLQLRGQGAGEGCLVTVGTAVDSLKSRHRGGEAVVFHHAATGDAHSCEFRFLESEDKLKFAG